MARSSSCTCKRRTALAYSNRPADWDAGVGDGSGVGEAVGSGVAVGAGVAVGTGVFVGTGVGTTVGIIVAVAAGGMAVGSGTGVGSTSGSEHATRSTANIGSVVRICLYFRPGDRNKFTTRNIKSGG